MKRPVLGLAIVLAMAIFSKPAVSQNDIRADSQELKHVESTMPGGSSGIRLTALRIDKEWGTSTMHLSGKVQIEILAEKGMQKVTVLQADAVDYHEDTGEIAPRGNVRLTVVDRK